MKTHSFKTVLAWSEADGRSSLKHTAYEQRCKGRRGITLNSSCFGVKHLLFIGA